jgi:hypothetical protein
MPHEGTNNIAFRLFAPETLVDYETYTRSLRGNLDGAANLRHLEAQGKRNELYEVDPIGWTETGVT